MVFGEQKLDLYDHLPAKVNYGKRHGTQVGDPPKAAKAMLDLALHPEPPLRIVLGSDAHAGMEAKMKTYRAEIDKWAPVSLSTDVDAK